MIISETPYCMLVELDGTSIYVDLNTNYERKLRNQK